ncbi:MAG: hypothetical protein ABJA80_04050 [bacterium]
MNGVWPITIAGWIALVIAVLGLLGVLYSYAKNMATLNGLGARVSDVEKAQKANEAREIEWIRALDRVTASQEALLERIGQASKGAQSCSEDMERYAIEIGSKFDHLTKVVNEEGRRAGERLQAVETELRITRETKATDRQAHLEREEIRRAIEAKAR